MATVVVLVRMQDMKQQHAAELQQAVTAEQAKEAAAGQHQVHSKVHSQLTAWQDQHGAELTQLRADHAAQLSAASAEAAAKLAALQAEVAVHQHALVTEAAAQQHCLEQVSIFGSPMTVELKGLAQFHLLVCVGIFSQ